MSIPTSGAEHPASRPYVLWFDTLPSVETARVFIWPRSPLVGVVLHVNGRAKRAEERDTVEKAERLGWEWHSVLAHTTRD